MSKLLGCFGVRHLKKRRPGKRPWKRRTKKCECGELYCKTCVKYQRKLNDLAHLDPNGKLQKVCEPCYEEGPQNLGQIRSHTSEFAARRHDAKVKIEKTSGVTLRQARKEQLDVRKECKRLTDGFKQSVGSSGFRKLVLDMKSTVTIPNWQRSPNWVYEKLCLTCIECCKSFNVTRLRRGCAVCGAAICRSCTEKNLLIYIPDGGNTEEVHWAIIRIVGCPSKEPSFAIHLRICNSCSSSLQDIQVEQHQVVLDNIAADRDPWPKVVQINDRLVEVQAKIDQHLPKYQELVDALEITPGSLRSLPASKKSNTQILSKAQCDLNDHFTQFVSILMALKKHKQTSHIKAVIFRNIIKSKCEYYQEKMYLFRECKSRLEEVTPAEVLESIQQFVDINSLNSSYVCIKQLALESIHLCTKYEATSSVTLKLAALEAVVLEDLKKAVAQMGENWADHEEALNRFIEEQIKERRLINPSHRLIKQHGAAYLTTLIDQRCQEVLQKVGLQVTSKCADSSYQQSKQVINEYLEENECEDEDMGWEMVSV